MVAKLKAKKKPHISVTVVKIGPEASAVQSIFIRRSIRGVIPPKLTATNVLTLSGDELRLRPGEAAKVKIFHLPLTDSFHVEKFLSLIDLESSLT